MKHLPSYFLVLFFTGAALAADLAPSPVTARRLPSGAYELTLTLQNTTDILAAQRVLVPAAQKVCGGQMFEFGHYSFSSTEQNPISSVASISPRVTIHQEVTCGPVAPASAQHTSYDWSPSDADDKLVAARTQQYLAQKDKGELALAYGQFSDTMKVASRFDIWSKGVEDFNAKAGGMNFRKIRKVSWVKDPPGVDPGFYAAVDYSGQFKNIPYECGYVAWYRDASGQLAIVREEEGYIDRKSQAAMTSGELRETLAKIRCVDG